MIAVGYTPKPRVGLRQFLSRSPDCEPVLAAVRSVTRSGHAQVSSVSLTRRVVVEPLICGRLVHGAWVRVSGVSDTDIERPRAWALAVDPATGIISGLGTGTDRLIDSRVSIAEAMEVNDFGDTTRSLLAQLVASSDETGTHRFVGRSRAVGRAPHEIGLCVRFDTAGGPRLLRGIAHDVGVITAIPRGTTIEAEVAAALRQPDQYVAITDLATLELLFWYGPAPTDIAWRARHWSDRERLHVADFPVAERMASQLLASPNTQVPSQRLRFLTRAGHYQAFDTSARSIALGDTASAALVTLRRSI